MNLIKFLFYEKRILKYPFALKNLDELIFLIQDFQLICEFENTYHYKDINGALTAKNFKHTQIISFPISQNGCQFEWSSKELSQATDAQKMEQSSLLNIEDIEFKSAYVFVNEKNDVFINLDISLNLTQVHDSFKLSYLDDFNALSAQKSTKTIIEERIIDLINR